MTACLWKLILGKSFRMCKSWFIVMLYIFLRIINMDRACLISIVFPQNQIAIPVLFSRHRIVVFCQNMET